METKVGAMINIVYFSANYPNDFIAKAWEGNQHLIDHLSEKLLNKASSTGLITKQAFFDWFMELSQNNQVLLCEWIDNNYKSFNIK